MAEGGEQGRQARKAEGLYRKLSTRLMRGHGKTAADTASGSPQGSYD